MQKTRSAELPIPLETAYGIAYNHELQNNTKDNRVEAEKVYHLADERMYAMKAAMKSNLVRK